MSTSNNLHHGNTDNIHLEYLRSIKWTMQFSDAFITNSLSCYKWRYNTWMMNMHGVSLLVASCVWAWKCTSYLNDWSQYRIWDILRWWINQGLIGRGLLRWYCEVLFLWSRIVAFDTVSCKDTKNLQC